MSAAYRNYVLGCLTLAYTLTTLDGCLVSLLAQPIKLELHLSDTEVGLLTGVAFGLFFSLSGVPFARWADRGNRATITSIAVGVWSIAVMLCWTVTSFLQLLITRLFAGLGAGGCVPPTYSLLGDYFPASTERTYAMTMYMLAGPAAFLLSYVCGGWINDHFGWRAALFAMGAPGMVVACLMRFTVKERRPAGHSSTKVVKRAGMGIIWRALWQRRSARHLCTAIILVFLLGLGLSNWYATFMIRFHGMSTSELGLWLGPISGLGGIAGILAGGHAATRWFGEDERSQMRICALAMALEMPLYALFFFLPGKKGALMALLPLMIIANVTFGPIFALMQRLVEDDIRATTMALVMLLASLTGWVIGPQAIGALSDALTPYLGGESLRYAMALFSCVALWAGYHFCKAGTYIREDLANVAAG